MDIEKVGKTIAYLRKRAGYTQKDLADRIGISDKAVSKWERGLGLPEIGCLRKLSILLGTDTDSLLAGETMHHESLWSGLIVLPDNKYGIGAETLIYDKPLINYILSYFVLVGIHDLTIAGREADKDFIDRKFGSGEEYGIKLTMVVGGLDDAVRSKEWNENIMLVYSRSLIYGVDQTRFFQKAMIDHDRFTMMVMPKKISHQKPHIVIDQDRKVISSNSGEPLRTQYDFTDIPILFFPSSVLTDMARASSIPEFISDYAVDHDLYVQMLDRGFVEFEIDDWNNVQEASTFIKIVQDKCGMNVYCIEEVAWRRGLISLEQLKKLGEKASGTEYGEYIMSLYNRIVTNSETQ